MGRAEDLFSLLQAGGDEYIAELIATRKSEESFLDFKRSADNGAGAFLHDNDRKNLEKCLSGFANSEGGVVVWGIDARSVDDTDGASGRYPIANAAKFASQVDGAMSGCTVPPVSGAHSTVICADSAGAGIVATLIPQSRHAPHQTTKERVFYIRSGSTFQPAMHSVIAGLFGKGPRAHVVPRVALSRMHYVGHSGSTPLDYVANVGFRVDLMNDSAVVAADMYVTGNVLECGGDRSTGQCFSISNNDQWSHSVYSQRETSLVAMPHTKLAPRGRVSTLMARFEIRGPITEGLRMLVTAGSAGAPPTELVLGIDDFALQAAYINGWERWADEQIRAQVDWHERAATFLGIEDYDRHSA